MARSLARSSTQVPSVPQPSDVVPDVDFSTLKLDVERIQFKWNAVNVRYDTLPDDGDQGDASKGVPQYTPAAAFAVVRIFAPTQKPNVFSISKRIYAWNPSFIQAAKAVLSGFVNIVWTAKPLKLDPDEMLSFLPNFQAYFDTQKAQDGDNHKESIEHLSFFINLLEAEYANKLSTMRSLVAERQITFDYVWGVFVPGSLVVTHCGLTHEPWVVRLISCSFHTASMVEPAHWLLTCDSVDVEDGLPGLVDRPVKIYEFDGAENIVDLAAFSIDPYLEKTHRDELCAKLIERGRRRWELSRTWCHKNYEAIAYGGQVGAGKITINSKIILDEEKYARHSKAGHIMPSIVRDLDRKPLVRKGLSKKGDFRRIDIKDEEFLMMPAIVHGFSLSDRKWLIFNVNDVKDIQWNLEAFDHLDIAPEKKEVVKTLIESHTQKAAIFDDFVPGKGRGLIFALHGPPGVGKTLTAEATSEVARAPLYMVGAGDLGTTANELDNALTTLLSLASAWKAIVLIDEADVFLEKRDVHDLVRNAMVAVFLRQLEYYTGILVLTTNRLNVIDAAIKSRIHVSLHYDPLGIETRERLWLAFLQKAGLHGEGANEVDTELMKGLCQRNLNGREIKNAIKTATTFAAYHGRVVDIHDVLRVVRIMDDLSEIE